MQNKQDNAVWLSLSAALPLVHEDGKLPTRFKVLNWGSNPNANKAPVVVGQALVAALSDPVYPFRTVALDWNHNTCPGTPAYKETKEPRGVAGYGVIEVIPGDGVYLAMNAWTPEGVKAAANFLDVSAVPLTDKKGNVIAIHSVALCRNGSVPDMEFRQVALSMFSTQTKGPTMDAKQMLLELLKLPADADDATIEAAKKAYDEAKATPAPMSADISKLVTEAVQVAVQPLSAEIEKFKTNDLAAAKQRILDAAKLDGKVIALNADGIGQLSVVALQALVDATAVTVPLAARTPTGLREEAHAVEPTDEQKAIALSCGVDWKDVYKKDTK